MPTAPSKTPEVVDVEVVVPVGDHPLSPRDGEGLTEAMTDWIPGSVKPHHDGPYLRQFDEGDALSWWHDERWNMDSFFAGPSDIQDAPWRGFHLSRVAPCERCGGKGQVMVVLHNHGEDFQDAPDDCPECDASGIAAVALSRLTTEGAVGDRA